MNCRRARKLIPMIFDGETPPEVVSAVEAHKDACGNCRRYYDGVKKLVALARAPGDIRAPGDFTSKIMSAVARERATAGSSVHSPPDARWFFTAPQRWAFAAGALAAAVLISAVFTFSRRNAEVLYVGPHDEVILPAGYSRAAAFRKETSGYVKIRMDSAADISGVSLEITLPEGLRLAGGGARALWRGDLKKGQNLVILKVEGATGDEYVIDGVLRKNGLSKPFARKVNIT